MTLASLTLARVQIPHFIIILLVGIKLRLRCGKTTAQAGKKWHSNRFYGFYIATSCTCFKMKWPLRSRTLSLFLFWSSFLTRCLFKRFSFSSGAFNVFVPSISYILFHVVVAREIRIHVWNWIGEWMRMKMKKWFWEVHLKLIYCRFS